MLFRLLKAAVAALGASGFAVTTLLTVIQIWPATETDLSANKIVVFVGCTVLVVLAGASAYMQNGDMADLTKGKTRFSKYHGEPDPIDNEVSEYTIRFGRPEDVKGINAIARMHFPPELILDIDEIARWLAPGLNIFRVAVKRERDGAKEEIVAYYAIFPLGIKTYEQLKNHQINEKDIRLEDFHAVTSPRTEAIYVLDLARHSDVLVGTIMIRDLVRYMATFVQDNHSIRLLGTWAFTEKGRSIAETFGMHRKLVYKDYANTGFYETTRQEFQKIMDDPSSLIARIMRHPFEEEYTID